ncbi:MAG TPA: HRDC domain-containing protein, partial [Thermomicrobiales bacterium]|nr:HRDC domain-containing protein [Thermomicrobiales bacterium]
LALLDRLKAWRTEQARERGVPAYVVAQDRMLQDLVLRRPATTEELLTVKGFGAARVDTYGDDLLALLADNDRDS